MTTAVSAHAQWRLTQPEPLLLQRRDDNEVIDVFTLWSRLWSLLLDHQFVAGLDPNMKINQLIDPFKTNPASP